MTEDDSRLDDSPLDRRPIIPADPEVWETVGDISFPKALPKPGRKRTPIRKTFRRKGQPVRPRPSEAEEPCTVFLVESGAYLRTPKDDNFIEALKALVPWNERKWIPGERSWFVTYPYTSNATNLVRLFFNNVIVVDYGIEESRLR